jgi:lipopolysaccharide/colanic/teichoic acid biosynthesis glycosyltransferase
VTSRPILSPEFVRFEFHQAPEFPALFLFERISAVFLLVALAPILLALSVVIFVISGQPPVIGDRRVGRNGQMFWMFKLRTMWPRNGERPKRFRWVEYLHVQTVRRRKSAADPRVTSAFAAFCRRHSIDELLQLWHVITGEMSYVGPRPVTAVELEEHYGLDAGKVLSMRPGLSGLWQVTGRSRLNYRQRKRLDLYLVRNYSASLYFAILHRTAKCVVKGDSAW